jgi:malonyl CoA-acyl carrier protein transacylase
VSNVDAAPHSDPDAIKAILASQLTAPVQWETTLRTLLDKGLQHSYEIGPNKVGGLQGGPMAAFAGAGEAAIALRCHALRGRVAAAASDAKQLNNPMLSPGD